MIVSPVTAKIVYKQSVVPYELGYGIETSKDVWRAIQNHGPNARGREKGVIGQATGKLGSRYKINNHGNTCSIEDLVVSVDVTLRLPEWTYQSNAKSEAVAYFSCALKTVTKHEVRHGEIWRETARTIEDNLRSKMRRTSCERFRERASAIFNYYYTRGRKRQARFDEADYKKPRYQKCWRLADAVRKNSRQTGFNRYAEPDRPDRRLNNSGVEERYKTASRRTRDRDERSQHIKTDFNPQPEEVAYSPPELGEKSVPSSHNRVSENTQTEAPAIASGSGFLLLFIGVIISLAMLGMFGSLRRYTDLGSEVEESHSDCTSRAVNKFERVGNANIGAMAADQRSQNFSQVRGQRISRQNSGTPRPQFGQRNR